MIRKNVNVFIVFYEVCLSVAGVLKASRKVEVHFVDFGNREVVECEDLRDITETILTELPVQALSCCLHGIDQTSTFSVWTPPDIAAFEQMVCDQLLDVYITQDRSSEGHYQVHLLRDQENINRNFLRSRNRLSRGYMTPTDVQVAT